MPSGISFNSCRSNPGLSAPGALCGFGFLTVHWRGLRIENEMNDVPYLTQFPVAQGETVSYRFTPPDAGTNWYHPLAIWRFPATSTSIKNRAARLYSRRLIGHPRYAIR
ncbi:MAG: multicopper oxidase domain-containing protein [Paracoccaceae bacterium]